MSVEILKGIWDNEELKLGYYPKTSYNKNTNTGVFTEFKYEGVPLLLNRPQLNRQVYSILFGDASFSNTCIVKLNNKTLTEATSDTTSREVSYYSKLLATGFNFDDYVWRLFFKSGLNYYPVYTGEMQKVKPNEKFISLTLNSSTAKLSDRDGSETKTDFAGWNTNIRFADALSLLIQDTNINVEGDIDTIDYGQTENEGDLDLVGKPNGHTSYYAENVIYVCGYGTYNFVDGSVNRNIGGPGNNHFHFIDNNGDHNYVYDKDEYELRRGEYIPLYLYNQTTDTSIDLGMGRAPEVTGSEYESRAEMTSIDGKYCSDPIYDVTYEFKSHILSDASGTGYSALSEVYESEVNGVSYYCPITSIKAIFGSNAVGDDNKFNWDHDGNQIFVGGWQENTKFGGSGIDAGDLNSQACDYFFSALGNPGVTDQYYYHKTSSFKNRGYFYYDNLQNRLFFQRASTLYPAGSSYTVVDDFEKNWDNFGLNPIGYYSLQNDTLGYSNISNDLFFDDLVFDNNMGYGVGYDMSGALAYSDTKTHKVVSISNSGSITTKWSLIGYECYGLSYFTHSATNYLSLLLKDSSSNWNWRYSTDDTILKNKPIGSDDFWIAPTSAEVIDGDIVLISFYQQQMTVVNLFNTNPNITYIGETLQNAFGGYLIKNELTEDYSGKIENNVISGVSEVRVEVFDLSDLTKLQALMKLCKMANKFMYVDEYDTLHLKNQSNVLYNAYTFDRILEDGFEIMDYDGYKSINMKTYNTKREDEFEWSYNSPGEWDGDIKGFWYGPDASFIVNVKIIDTSSFSYKVTSSATRLVIAETIKSGITDWKNVTVDIDANNFVLKFIDNDFVEKVPSDGNKFTMIFNTKNLLETSSPLIENDLTLGLTKTITIDNRFIDPNNSTFLMEEINDFYLANKSMYRIKTLEPYANFDLLQLVNINRPYDDLDFIRCYIIKATINSDGTTELILIEE